MTILKSLEIPIGAILPWLKSYANTPSLPPTFVECNGQTLNDSDSPYDGQTIPDLNGDGGTQRFLRGSSSSGSTGGSACHYHTSCDYGCNYFDSGGDYIPLEYTSNTDSIDSTPEYYEVVYIMRVK